MKIKINRERVMDILLILVFSSTYLLSNVITVFYKPCYIFLMLFVFHSKIKIRRNVFPITILLYFTIIYLTGNNLKGDFSMYVGQVLYGLMFMVATSAEYTTYEIRNMISSLILGCTLFVFMAIISNPLFTPLTKRVTVKILFSVTNANVIGQIACMGMIMSFGKWMYSDGNKKILIIALMINLYGIWLSGSRSSVVTSSLCILIFCFEKYWEIIKKDIIKALLCLVAFGSLVAFFFGQQLYTKIGRGFNISSFTDTSNRQVNWLAAIKVWNENKLFGKGFTYYERTTGIFNGQHNFYLWALDVGGIILLIIIFIYVFNVLFRIRKMHILLVFIAVFLSQGIVENSVNYFMWIPLMLTEISYTACSKEKVNDKYIFGEGSQ